MSERETVLDEPVMDEQSETVRKAVERAERAEAELAKLKHAQGAVAGHEDSSGSGRDASGGEGHAAHDPQLTGLEALRQESMMAHLLDSLDAGKNIGHYGRLVFAMIARHFLSDAEVIAELTKDPDFSQEQATLMLRQVEGRDYNPPKRDRILEWQAQQEFPILPNVNDPDCGNVYRNLTFPQQIYDHIEHYQEEKAEAGE